MNNYLLVVFFATAGFILLYSGIWFGCLLPLIAISIMAYSVLKGRK